MVTAIAPHMVVSQTDHCGLSVERWRGMRQPAAFLARPADEAERSDGESAASRARLVVSQTDH